MLALARLAQPMRGNEMSDFAAGFASGVGNTAPQAAAQAQQLGFQRQVEDRRAGMEQQQIDIQKSQLPTEEEKLLRMQKLKAETAHATNLASADVLLAEKSAALGSFGKAAAEGSPEALAMEMDLKRSQTARAKADAAIAKATSSDDAIKILLDMQRTQRDQAVAQLSGSRLENKLREIDMETAPAMADLRLRGAISELQKSGLAIDEAKMRNRIAQFESSDQWLKTRQESATAELQAARTRDRVAGEEAAMNKLRTLYQMSGQQVQDEVLAERAKDSYRFLAQVYDATGDEGAAMESADALDRIMAAKQRIEDSGVTRKPIIEAYQRALRDLGDISQVSSADVSRPSAMQKVASAMQAIAELVSPSKTSLAKSQSQPEVGRVSLTGNQADPTYGMGSRDKTALNSSIASVLNPAQPFQPGVKMPITGLSTPETAKPIADAFFNKTGGGTVIVINDRVVKFPKNVEKPGTPEAKAEADFDYRMSARGNTKWLDAWNKLLEAGLPSHPSESDVARLKKLWVDMGVGKWKWNSMNGDKTLAALADIRSTMSNPFMSDYLGEPAKAAGK